MKDRDFFTIAEIAQNLSVSTVTVQTWCREGKLPSYRLGRSYRVSKDEFSAWAKNNNQSPKNEAREKNFNIDLYSLFQGWLLNMEKGTKPLSPDTIRTHRQHFQKHLRMLLVNDSSLTYSETVAGKNLDKVLSSLPVIQFATRYNLYSSVISFANFLVQQGLLEKEAATSLRQYKPRRLIPAKKTVLNSIEEVNKFLDAIWLLQSHSNYEKTLNTALVGMMAFAGLRVSEVANVDLSHLDLNNKIIHVENGKGGKNRLVGINQRLEKMILEYLKIRPMSSNSSLFLSRKKTPLQRDLILRRISRISKRSGLKVTPHGLRRTFATLNANAGKSINLIQLALGHSDLNTTQKYLMANQRVAATEMQQWNL